MTGLDTEHLTGGSWEGNPSAGADAVTEFASRFGLDSQATEYLSSLPEDIRSTIISEFAPRHGTLDITGKLYAFARSIETRQTAVGQMTPEFEMFAQKWGLDGAAVAWLSGLPPDVASILMEQFDPKEDTHNVIAKMKGFARSIQARLPGQRADGVVMDPEVLEGLPDRIKEFAAHWGIEESAVGLIQSLPPDVQVTVIDQFDPKGDVLNVTGKLCAFARSIAAGRSSLIGADDAVETFSAQWGLDDGAKHFLRMLPEDVLATVLQQFDPAAGTKDIVGKLKMFARGVLGSSQHHSSSRRFSEVYTEEYAGDEHTPAAVNGAISYVATAETQRAASSTADPVISAFVVRWGLESGSVALLESLADDVRAIVMEEFDPRGNTRNVGAKLRAFATTVANSQGRGRPTPAEEQLITPVSVKLESAAESTIRRPAEPDIGEAEFLEKWGLADCQTAADVLSRLHPPVRARVMTEFAPGMDTRDVLGKLCGFATSVARAAAKEGAAQLPPLSRPPLVAPRKEAERQPIYPLSHGGRRQMTPDEFAEMWQLDEGSRALLRGLEPEVQATVVAEFQPRGVTRDTSGKFCAFARSVASRLGLQGHKRPLSSVASHSQGPPLIRPRIGPLRR